MTTFRAAKGIINAGGAPNEKVVTAAPRTHISDGSRRAVILLPGHNGDAFTPFSSFASFQVGDAYGALDAGLPIVVLDAGGGQAWSNDAAIARVDEAIDWIGASGLGIAGSAILLGTSMGSGLAVAYAAAHPAKVRALGLVYPAMDLAYLHDTAGFSAEINTAYGSGANYTAALPTHDPLQLAAAGALNGLPIKGWFSTNDNTVGPTTWATFKDRLATGGAPAPDERSLGAVGHGDNTLVPRADVAAWLKAHA